MSGPPPSSELSGPHPDSDAVERAVTVVWSGRFDHLTMDEVRDLILSDADLSKDTQA